VREAALLQSVSRLDKLGAESAACMKLLMLKRTAYATARHRLSFLSGRLNRPPITPSQPRPNSRNVPPDCETASVAEFGSRDRGGDEIPALALRRAGANNVDKNACRLQPGDKDFARGSRRQMQIERRSNAETL